MTNTRPMAIATEPGKIEFEDRPLPELGPHDVQLTVKAVSICGSDLHIFKGRHPTAPLPVPVGHEIAGKVTAVGEHVTRRKIGDRVAVEPVIACGECYFCQRGDYHLCTNISFQYRVGQGGFTPVFVAQEPWLHRLPENISYAEGALLEPLSVAVHAVRKSGIGLGDSCAIFGAGPIGLMILNVLNALGCGDTFVVDIADHRLDKAIELGATKTFNNLSTDAVEAIFEATDHLGAAYTFEAVGIETTLVQTLQALKKGGTAVLVGLFEDPQVSIPANIFVQKEITLSGSQGYNWDFQTAIQLIESGHIDLKPMITHEFPLESVQEAFDLLTDRDSKPVKVVVTLPD